MTQGNAQFSSQFDQQTLSQIINAVMAGMQPGDLGGSRMSGGFGMQSAGGGGQISPQFDFGSILKTAIPIAIQIIQGLQSQPGGLPGMGGQSAVGGQGATPGQLSAQFDFGGLLKTVLPIAISIVSALQSQPGALPGMGGQGAFGGQSAFGGQGATSGQLSAQFDFGGLLKTVLPIAISIVSALQSQPGGLPGVGMQGAMPGQAQGQISPQFDFGSLLRTTIPIALQIIQSLQSQQGGLPGLGGQSAFPSSWGQSESVARQPWTYH